MAVSTTVRQEYEGKLNKSQEASNELLRRSSEDRVNAAYAEIGGGLIQSGVTAYNVATGAEPWVNTSEALTSGYTGFGFASPLLGIGTFFRGLQRRSEVEMIRKASEQGTTLKEVEEEAGNYKRKTVLASLPLFATTLLTISNPLLFAGSLVLNTSYAFLKYMAAQAATEKMVALKKYENATSVNASELYLNREGSNLPQATAGIEKFIDYIKSGVYGFTTIGSLFTGNILPALFFGIGSVWSFWRARNAHEAPIKAYQAVDDAFKAKSVVTKNAELSFPTLATKPTLAEIQKRETELFPKLEEALLSPSIDSKLQKTTLDDFIAKYTIELETASPARKEILIPLLNSLNSIKARREKEIGKEKGRDKTVSSTPKLQPAF